MSIQCSMFIADSVSMLFVDCQFSLIAFRDFKHLHNLHTTPHHTTPHGFRIVECLCLVLLHLFSLFRFVDRPMYFHVFFLRFSGNCLSAFGYVAFASCLCSFFRFSVLNASERAGLLLSWKWDNCKNRYNHMNNVHA